MKVLLVVHTFFPRWRAGTEVYTLDLARRLKTQGHEVFLVCYEPHKVVRPKLEAVDEQYEGFPVHRIFFSRDNPDQLLYEYFNPQVEVQLLEYFRRVCPDVVHVVHTMHLSAATLTAAQQLGLPLVCTAMDFWYVCPTFRLLRVDNSVCPGPVNILQCMRCCTRRGPDWRRRLLEVLSCSDLAARFVRSIVQVLGLLPGARSLTILRKMVHVVERSQRLRQIVGGVDVLIAPNQNTYNLLIQNGIVARRMIVLGFGLKLPVKVRKKSSRTLRLGYIGTLDHAKGVHILLEAFQRLQNREDLALTLYGDPRHYPDYYARLEELSGSDHRIKFGGTFPNDKIGQILSKIDLLVIPSLWYENTPLVLHTAFTTKTPVLVSNIGSLSDAVRHEVNGLIFEMGNSEDLARQIERVLNDRSLLERLRQGIQPVKSMDTHVQELLEIYATLATHSAVEPPRLQASSLSKWLRAMRKSSLDSGTRLGLGERTSLALGLRFRVARFDNWLELFQCKFVVESRRQVNLRLVWKYKQTPGPNLAVFVHFLNGRGGTSFQADHLLKDVLEHRSVSAREIMQYSFPVRIPDQVLPGSYEVRVGAWVPSEQRFLALTKVRGWRRDAWQGIRVGRIQVQ